MRQIKISVRCLFALAGALLAFAQAPRLVAVVSRPLARTVDLPGELQPFLSVAVRARISGYVDRVVVDRGSSVHQGDVLAELSAPELQAQIAEAESKAQGAESDRTQAEAQLSAAQSTADRLRKAAETPGAISGNELVQAEQQVRAARALVESRAQASRAAAAAAQSQKELQSYLRITAPFDGVVTDRMAHPGALVGPGTEPLLVVQQVSRLRLIVPVPEQYVGALARGAGVPFHVPAFPERVFTGTIARVSHALDPKTRTMAVELDVVNRDGALAPGMYPSAKWPVRTGHPALLVPKTSVVTTTERTFLVRDKDGRAEWVDVKRGAAEGDLVEVVGNLHAGDSVLRRGSDEVREGTKLK